MAAGGGLRRSLAFQLKLISTESRPSCVRCSPGSLQAACMGVRRGFGLRRSGWVCGVRRRPHVAPCVVGHGQMLGSVFEVPLVRTPVRGLSVAVRMSESCVSGPVSPATRVSGDPVSDRYTYPHESNLGATLDIAFCFSPSQPPRPSYHVPRSSPRTVGRAR